MTQSILPRYLRVRRGPHRALVSNRPIHLPQSSCSNLIRPIFQQLTQTILLVEIFLECYFGFIMRVTFAQ